MQTIARIIRQQVLGAIALLVVLGGVGVAATGGDFKLGSSNTADRKSVLENTGNGPALQLKSKAGQPPLAVSNTVQVPRLNASLLQGKPANTFAVKSSVYTKAQSDAKYAAAGSSYTKSEADAAFAAAGSSYTKAETDAAAVYVTLLKTDFTGSSNGDGSDHVIASHTVTVPGPGVVTAIGLVKGSSGSVPNFRITVGGLAGFDLVDTTNVGGLVQGNQIAMMASGDVAVEVLLKDDNGNSLVSGNGTLLIVFIPM